MMMTMMTAIQTVTSVLMIGSDEQFSFQIATERGWKDWWQLRSNTGREKL